tara:strand:- start:272 stop:1540 length:1269 start_codon:yes stop_codon:yes gene_type:complete
MQKNELKYKAEKINITPLERLCLSGYSNSTPFLEIEDELEINVIILAKNNDLICFISADLLFLSKEFCKLAINKLGIPKQNIIMGATHTHSAPGIDRTKDKLGEVSADYCNFVLKKLSELISSLQSQRYKSVEIEYNKTTLNGSISRRKKAVVFRKKIIPHRGMYNYPNPQKKIDNQANFISLKNSKGKLVALIWQFACHPVCNPDNYTVSSDFPGKIRKKIREFEGNIPITFFQGFSGDIKPNSFDPCKKIKNKIVRYLNKGIAPFNSFGFQSKEAYNEWIEDKFLNIRKCLEQGSKKKNLSFNSSLVSFPLSKIYTKPNNEEKVEINIISISTDIYFVSISAEVCNDVSKLIPLGKYNIIKIGCSNFTFGYLPTSAMLDEGGYEVNGHQKYFDLVGNLKPEVDKIVHDALVSGFEKVKEV